MTYGFAALEARASTQEAALLDLLDRVATLERALEFEIGQREALEGVILGLSGFQKRLDRLELLAKAGRRGSAA